GLPVYPAGLTIGTPIFPINLAELFQKRVELLEAMVRGNADGFWVDLPHGGTMTQVQRDILTATIRARTMPEVYESDVRIRGSTNYGGRSYLFASGTVRRSVRGGGIATVTVEQLIDPASGLVVLSRTREGTGGGSPISPNTRTADAPFPLGQ